MARWSLISSQSPRRSLRSYPFQAGQAVETKFQNGPGLSLRQPIFAVNDPMSGIVQKRDHRGDVENGPIAGRQFLSGRLGIRAVRIRAIISSILATATARPART